MVKIVIHALAVGGTLGPVGSSGWDAWPLVGIALALWIGRRMLDIPWRAPLLISSLGAGLALPPAVHAWGVVPTFALTFVVSLAILLVRAAGQGQPPNTI